MIVFDRTPRLAVGETRQLAALRTELSLLEPGFGSTDLGAALRAGVEAGSKLNARRVRVVVISDYQRSSIRQALTNLPARPGVQIETIEVGERGIANASIASVQVLDSGPLTQRSVLVEIRRYGDEDVAGNVDLMLGDTLAGREKIEWTVENQRFLEFQVDVPGTEGFLLEARLRTDDALEGDNDFAIFCEGSKALPLLVLHRNRAVQLASSEEIELGTGVNRYVMAAIQAYIGRVDATWMDASRAAPNRLNQFPVVLALDCDTYSIETVARLKEYVNTGGVAVLVPGRGNNAAIKSLSGSAIQGWKESGTAPSQYRLVSTIRQQGPMGLLGTTGESVLGHPRVYRYMQTSPAADSGVVSIAQFDDGAPFLLERRVGDGLVYLFTVPLETSSTDFVLRASFAPFLFELMTYAANEIRPARSYLVGDSAPLALLNGVDIIRMPDGRTVEPQQLPSFEDPGAYAFEGGGIHLAVAVHVDQEESDTTRLNGTEIREIASLIGEGEAYSDDPWASARIEFAGAPDEAGRFWRILLIAALLVMIFETLLSSRTTR